MPQTPPPPRVWPRSAPLDWRRICFVLAAIPLTLIGLTLTLVLASRLFGFQIEWVNLSVAWVMVVVPSTLFVLATTTMRVTGKSGPRSRR